MGLTGLSSTSFVGALQISANPTVDLTGLSMTTQLGSVNNSYGWNIIDTGTSVVYTVVAA